MQVKKSIKARAIIPIFYSTATNTSKKIAYMLQDKLQTQHFLSNISNIGDFDFQQFIELSGPIVLIMSTYGNGGSPVDGEDFVNLLRKLEKKNIFENVQLAILGLGNKSFQHFCGNAKTVRQLMLRNGAKQILELTTCSSSSHEQSVMHKFPAWSDQLIAKLKLKYELKDINTQQLLQKYKIVTKNENIGQDQWTKQIQKWEHRLGKQFINYHKAYKADVVHIKQIRKSKDGRSTLQIRLKTPQGFSFQPACNISVFPQNVRKQGESQLTGTLIIQTSKQNAKIPYPPLPLQKLWKIANLNQLADENIIKYAIALSEVSPDIKNKYQGYFNNPQEIQNNPIRCYQLYQDLKLGIQFIIKLGINSVRAYTLASWTAQKQYIDLVASIDPLGLTSRYFQSMPTYLKILKTQSTFYLPSNRPIVMIANGTGIAPFRSLTQYFIQQQEVPSLHLYFGIQNKQIDFYFKQEWQNLQKQGKIKLRIAESRTNPTQKIYVQNILKQDKNFICKHLIQNNGVIFMCGSAAMAKSVEIQIFEAIKLHQPIPFQAFKLYTGFLKNRTIVKEIYG